LRRGARTRDTGPDGNGKEGSMKASARSGCVAFVEIYAVASFFAVLSNFRADLQIVLIVGLQHAT
jgi:hypothetical protein